MKTLSWYLNEILAQWSTLSVTDVCASAVGFAGLWLNWRAVLSVYVMNVDFLLFNFLECISNGSIYWLFVGKSASLLYLYEKRKSFLSQKKIIFPIMNDENLPFLL